MMEALDTLIPPSEYQPYQSGREVEYAQPLVDLGFLAFANIQNKTAIHTALSIFRKAYRTLGWLQSTEDEWSEKLQLTIPDAEEPDSLEIKLLHLLVDMDGDFQLTVLPQSGDLTLYSRVVNYRLVLLGFLKREEHDYRFDPRVVDHAIAKLQSWTRIKRTSLEWLNLLGDVPELIREVYEKGGLDRRVVCFKCQPGSETIRDIKEEVDAENNQTIAAEQAAIATIETDLQALRPARIEARVREPLKAVSRKNRRRQSRVEELREEINEIVDGMKDILKEEAVVADQLLISITLLKEEVAEEEARLGHLKLDIKELEKQEKHHNELREQRKSIEKEIRKLSRKLEDTRNYRQALIVQENMLAELLQKQAEAPADKRHHFDTPINSAKDKIALLLPSVEIIDEIFSKRNQLLDIGEKLNFEAIIDEKLKEKKKEIDTQKKRLKESKKELKKLEEEHEKRVDEFGDTLSDEQQNIRIKAKRYRELLKKLEKIPRRFRRELATYLAPDFYKEVNQEILDRDTSPFFDDCVNDPYNAFLIRLIQLHQWINGYYNGMIDSDLGKVTFDSIREIDQDIKSMKLRFVLYRIHPQRGTWLLNVRYLFAEMLDSLDTFEGQDNFETIVQLYEEKLEKDPSFRKKEKELDKHWKKAIKETHQAQKKNKLRRIYFGVKSLARSVFRGIGRIFQLIFKTIKVLFRLLRNFVLMLYREIREGLRKFAQGIAFLFGKRQVTTNGGNGLPAVVTRFDFDCDVVNFAAVQGHLCCPPHINHCHTLTANLHFALTLTAQIIEWTFRAITLGWATIFIRIALYFKRQVTKFLKKNAVGLVVKVFVKN